MGLVATIIFLLTICWGTTTGELPSSCLTSLTTYDSVQCCRASPFLEISFILRFGCDVPNSLEKGVRLEIRTATMTWQPLRFYATNVTETEGSIVRHIDRNMVSAEALTYSSNFSLQVVQGNREVLIREYVCDPLFLAEGVRVRWMQRFAARSAEGIGTWSLDNVTLTVWNGHCRYQVLHEVFDKTLSDGYGMRSGTITIPECGSTSGNHFYFNEDANQDRTSRRSLTTPRLNLGNTQLFCSNSTVTSTESCDVPECGDGRSVCSIGTVQCESCYSGGYYVQDGGALGACQDVDECSLDHNCEQVCVNTPGSYHCECRSGFSLSSNGYSCEDINECEISTVANCTQKCVNVNGSYECACYTGYKLSPNGFECEDVNECETPDLSECQQECTNTNGSYECTCLQGYSLASNGFTCQDIDECGLPTMNNCGGICVNTNGSYQCSCSSGFALSDDRLSCEDIDECGLPTMNNCGGICVNTNGSYQCSCSLGFVLSEDELSCEDIDECGLPMLNNCDGICVNTNGSYQCSCSSGFALSEDRLSCEDIDECGLPMLNNCDGICVNTNGSYQCSCSSGFALSEDRFSCEDIDECGLPMLNNCDGICVNTNGSYQCSCLSGFALSEDRFSCEDINECETPDLNQCQQECINTNGSYRCSCLQGYRLTSNGFTCQDIDECQLPTLNNCDGMCVNTNGSYQCSCTSGFTLLEDGLICEDINECETPDQNECHQECINTNGSYECSCLQGYRLASDKFTCQDIDECQLPTLNNCDGMCVNTNGSYQCSCSSGFTLSGDGFSCEDVNECETPDLNECQQECTNTNSSYECSCLQGYRLASNEFTCQDIDECQLPTLNNCDGMCVNTNGSYQCSCLSGFTLSEDGFSCEVSVRFAIMELTNLQNSLGKVSSTEFARILDDMVTRFVNAGILAPRNLSLILANTVDDFLHKIQSNQQMNNLEQAAVSIVLDTLDTFALNVYDSTVPELETGGFRLRVSTPEEDADRFEGISVGSNRITLPSLGERVKVSSFFFSNLSGALPPIESVENQLETLPVISSSVQCDSCDVSRLAEPVRYQLMINKANLPMNLTLGCYFYNLTTHNWSMEGCTYNESLSNDSISVCECTHLTHFAILLSPGSSNVTPEIAMRLEIIGYVGVSFSLFFLILTILALALIKSLWGMRNFIHINLCGSLMVAQLLFVVTASRTENFQLCQSFAVILHYAFLVTFMWMLMEGVVLYVVLVKVFVKKQKLYMLFFALVSYGLPLLYLCITVPVGIVLGTEERPHYGYNESCWLNPDTHFVWAFIAPVIVIFLINTGFFIMAVYIMRKHSKRLQKSHLTTFVQWLKSSVLLMITMGIPWIFGVLIIDIDALFPLAYIYTILFAFQGVIIFILLVPLSKQVRETYKKWWKGKVSESEILSKYFSSDFDRKSSFLDRFNSFRTSSTRVSKANRSTYLSSQVDDNDIKLPVSPSRDIKSPSQSPPPDYNVMYEEYMVQSQTVVSVGNGSIPHNSKESDAAVNGTITASDDDCKKIDLDINAIEMENNIQFTSEEKKLNFSDSIPDIRENKVDGTTL